MEGIKNKIDILVNKLNHVGTKIYKNRYYIAIVIFILCIIFEISGSSIGCWKEFLELQEVDDGVIIGKSRAIRSDEWSVLTPMTFSQVFDGFKYFSNIIRGGNTDVFMVYGLPILNLVQIFRPFQIGFLFLGVAKGLSFFWCGRFIALFMVTFELGMILTKKKKLLSFIMSILITLAPIVQWWFAVNGIVEIFVFGELAVILLHKYMNTQNFKKRCIYLLGMIICAGGYILVIYPAWQIPMFYVFLALAISVIITNRKNCKITRKDIISILIAMLIFICCMTYIFLTSWNTIKAVMNTVYPGARMETGGQAISKYFQYPSNLFYPYNQEGVDKNVCEESTMFTLFPIGIILAVISLIKDKKKDVFLITLLIIYGFLSIWCIIGFPTIIAKLTLLSNVQSSRAILAVGFIDILILVRSISNKKMPVKKSIAMVSSIILSIIISMLCKKYNQNHITITRLVKIFIIDTGIFYLLFRYQSKYVKGLLSCSIVAIMIISGGMVNPLRRGTDVIYNSEIIKQVQQIQKEENGKWIVEGTNFHTGNFILMAGVPVINSTNTYPDMEKWYKIDTEKKYEDVYNRYANITINIRNDQEMPQKKFKLLHPDDFEVNLTPQELQKLEVKYIFTANDLEKYNSDKYSFKKLTNINQFNIYKLTGN